MVLDDRLMFSCFFQPRAFCARLFVVCEAFMRDGNCKKTGRFVNFVCLCLRNKTPSFQLLGMLHTSRKLGFDRLRLVALCI